MESVAVATPREHRRATTSIGPLIALRSITLRNELPGTVRQVALVPGQVVDEGAVLLMLDTSAKAAALREASLTRLRPVLMTSAATVFGHLPLVLVSGPGAEARNSIGTVLFTGMIVETVFTLFVVPVFYSLIAAQHRPDPARDGIQDERATTVATATAGSA